MDTQTASNHQTRSKKKKAAAVVTKAKSAGQKVEQDVTGGVEEMIHDGQAKLEQITRGATGFVKRNPKASVGVALGAGVLIGALVDGRVAELAASYIHTLVKTTRKRFF